MSAFDIGGVVRLFNQRLSTQTSYLVILPPRRFQKIACPFDLRDIGGHSVAEFGGEGGYAFFSSGQGRFFLCYDDLINDCLFKFQQIGFSVSPRIQICPAFARYSVATLSL